MNAPLSWIAQARAEYQARPWVSWALRFKVPLTADLSTKALAARAVGCQLRPAQLDLLVAMEREIDGTDHATRYRDFMMFFSEVIRVMQRAGFDRAAIDAHLSTLYAKHGINIEASA